MQPSDYLVIDLEATCDDGGAVPKREMEIIEIGAVLVDGSSWAPLAEFQSFVRPVRHPRLTEFCCTLTSIAQADVDEAPSFPEALERLRVFAYGGDARPVFCSWGNYDRRQFEQDAGLHGVTLPFGPEHTRFFFGRDDERREILDDLAELDRKQQPRLLIVAGASGTGKSSVVLSGTVPDLTGRATAGPVDARESTDTKELVRTVQRLEALVPRYDTPAMRQGVSLLRRLAGDLEAGGHAMDYAVIKPGTDPDGALSRALTARGESTRPLLLVVDQFEELFTHGHEPQVRDGFCQKLWALCSGPSRVYVLCTIRVDFIGHCGQIVLDASGMRLDQVAYDDAHRVFIAQMAKTQLRECIERPALKVGLRLQPGLAERLLDDVRAEPGALPLISYTLDLLWQSRSAQGELTAAAYEALGGVAGAIEKKANDVYDGLDEVGQRFARRLLVRLIGTSESGARDTRRRVKVERLRPTDAPQARIFDAVLARFVDERLLVRGEESGSATIEVAHEALIRKWERLRRWVETDREMLAELDEVERFLVPWREYGTLLTGDQLAYARRVSDRFPQDISAETRELVALSTRARIRRARRRRAMVAAVMVTIAGFGIWGWINATRARTNAEIANAERDKTHRALVAEEDAKVRAEQARLSAEQAQTTAETARARTVREIVELSWIAASYHQPDAGMVTGIRDLASHLAPIVDLAKIQSLTETPVFLSGPHTSGPNLDAADFGHYNPQFVRWATENLIPAARDPFFRDKSQAVYDRYLEEMTRIYWRVGSDFAKDEKLLQRLAAQYGAVIDAWKDEPAEAGTSARFEHFFRASYSYAEAAGQGERWMTDNAPYQAGVAMGFWMRRELDGSRAEFMTMMQTLLQTYDHEFYAALEPSDGALGRLRRTLVGEWYGRTGDPLLLRQDGFWRQGEGSGTWSVVDLDGDVIVRVDESNVAIGIECCNQGITVRAGSTLVPGTYAPFPRPAPAP
ncbi:MAG: AAA family ATPase [Myxococcales bacterium]|nr:AAA family ATPase [Myxococcales bacterium]